VHDYGGPSYMGQIESAKYPYFDSIGSPNTG